ncbi:hypothetical protein Tco_0748426 [Tanacetum coccineum]|uniref:Uncharacterized protein n=1 Tax=Tanacetum coccineum TaxID=301880 RepID=A0ABQ4YVU8_9ASTR
MFCSDVTSHVRHSRLMDEFDRFTAKEGESLESLYERLTTFVNIMDRNNVRPIPVSINTKFLNCLQPEWSKYVTMVPHNQTGDTVSYDELNQAVIQDGRVDIQTKNAGYGGNGDINTRRQNKNQAFNVGTGNDESNQIVQRVPRIESTPGKYFREQMLLAMKDEAGSNLKDEKNDFMLDNSYGDETLEELTVVVIMMAESNQLMKMLSPNHPMMQRLSVRYDVRTLGIHGYGREMDLFAFICYFDPTKVVVGERNVANREAKLLVSTKGRTVPLTPPAPAALGDSDGGSRCGAGDGEAVMWRRGGVSIGDDRGGDVGGSEVVARWQRRCGSHDNGGVVEMRMCGGSVVGGGVG